MLQPTSEGSAKLQLRARTEEDILVDADAVFPIGIVLTELITNAFKYAFPNDRVGMILARARRSGLGRVEITLRDRSDSAWCDHL